MGTKRLHRGFGAAVALIALAALLCLGGCRYTDILTEHLEDPVSGTLDLAAEPIYEEHADAPVDVTRQASTPGETNNQNKQENTLPTYSTDSTTTVQTDQRQQEPQTDKQDEATEGDEQSEAEGDAATGVDGNATGGSKIETSSKKNDDAEKGDDENKEAGDDDEGGDDPNAGKGGKGKVYSDGTYKNLPEDVGTIAATGQYAVIVQMLAGRGGLAACDKETLATMKQRKAFEYGEEDPEGLDNIKAAWSGDGSKSGSLDVNALVKAKPDAVITDGASTALSAKESDRLTDAGIDVVSAPRLGTTYTSDADIVTAVRLVGTLLKKADTQYNANKMAKTYVSMHDDALQSCRSANGGYSYKVVFGRSMDGIYQGTSTSGEATKDLSDIRVYTAYIDQWTNKTKSKVTSSRKFGTATLYLNGKAMDVSDGVGLSAMCSKGNFVLMDYYLQQSGVVDNSFDTAKPVASGTGKSLPYALIAGNPEAMLDIEFNRRSIPSALWFSITGATDKASWTLVGDEVFPALMVRDKKIAASVVTSAKKENGLYNVGQAYQVFVMPSGLAGSWADGTVESYLLAPWAYDMFQGDGALDACTDYLDEFYECFYRASYKDVLKDSHNVKQVKATATQEEEEPEQES